MGLTALTNKGHSANKLSYLYPVSARWGVWIYLFHITNSTRLKACDRRCESAQGLKRSIYPSTFSSSGRARKESSGNQTAMTGSCREHFSSEETATLLSNCPFITVLSQSAEEKEKVATDLAIFVQDFNQHVVPMKSRLSANWVLYHLP